MYSGILILIFLIANDFEQFFMDFFATLSCYFGLFITELEELFMLYISVLSDICFASMFSHSVAYPFISLTVSFDE